MLCFESVTKKKVGKATWYDTSTFNKYYHQGISSFGCFNLRLILGLSNFGYRAVSKHYALTLGPFLC